jgi:hypothetical protein
MSQPVVWGCERVVSFGRERKEGGAVRAVAFGAALRGLSLASQSVRHLVSYVSFELTVPMVSYGLYRLYLQYYSYHQCR